MASVVEHVGEKAVSDVVVEAFKEATGKTNRKWGLLVLGILVGTVVAAAIIQKLSHR